MERKGRRKRGGGSGGNGNGNGNHGNGDDQQHLPSADTLRRMRITAQTTYKLVR